LDDDLDALSGGPSLPPALGFYAIRAAHRSGTHDVLILPSNPEGGDAAYRRAALVRATVVVNDGRCDAPTLLATADEVIE